MIVYYISIFFSTIAYPITSGACYRLQVHLVLVTKYRKKVINKEMLSRLEQIFRDTCFEWESSGVEFNGEEDHIHLLIDYNHQVEISKFVNNLKPVSSRLIRKEFAEHIDKFYYKPVFWTGAYSVSSCGGVTLEQLKAYVLASRSSRRIMLLRFIYWASIPLPL
jgi:putative transposase